MRGVRYGTRGMVRIIDPPKTVVPALRVEPPPVEMKPTDLTWQWGLWFYHRPTNTYHKVPDARA